MADAAQPGHMPLSSHYVMVPIARRNWLGIIGLLLAIIGLFIPTGIVAVLGLMLSLVAVGRPPRTAAVFGVLIGLFGTFVWLAIDLLVLLGIAMAGVGGAGFAAAGFVLTQTQVVELTADMINVAGAVAERAEDEGDGFDRPSLADLDVNASQRLDPWGTEYQLDYVDDDRGIEMTSAGPDTTFGTDDDIRLSQLERVWEDAFENFGRDMERFGERWEALERAQRHHQRGPWMCDDGIDGRDEIRIEIDRPRSRAEVYEQEALEDLGDVLDELQPVDEDASETEPEEEHPTSEVPPPPASSSASGGASAGSGPV